MQTWFEERADGRFRLKIAIQPSARKNEIIGVHDGCLKVKIAAPPVDGAANEGLINFIAECLRAKPRQLSLVSGQTSRRKVIEVEGISLEIIQAMVPVP